MSEPLIEDTGRLSARDLETRDLAARLAEAEETIRAIHLGEVDAVVVKGPAGPKVYTLEGADHHYRVMVEQMREGTVTLNRDHWVLYSNPQFGALMETPVASVPGSSFDRFLPPAEVKLFAAVMQAAFVHGYSSCEVNLLAANAGLVPVRLSLTLLEISGIETVCVIAADLREQIRNEALVKEEQLSRLIFDQAGEGIVVIDPSGGIVRCNAGAADIAGRPILLNRFDDIFSMETADGPIDAENILSTARAGAYIRGLEATMLHPDGRRYSLLVSASPLWGQSKNLLGCVITMTDITRRKQLEEAQARQAGELVRSNADLRQFTYSASHDLREPLRQIAVFMQLLQQEHRRKLDDDANLLIQQTVDAAHRMENLLRDLLAYSEAADAPQEVVAPTPAEEVIRKTMSVFESQIAETGARVEYGPLPALDVHETHLTQLFQNLIGNALKYRSEAPPVIHISAERMNKLWKISVADNGIGIDPKYQAQVFGLFKRLHGGDKYSGTGMGLAICQKIVQRYGGTIWVESELGRGSQFIFTLPGET